VGERRFATILADPPWQFTNKTGKVAPEHKRLSRYNTLTLDEIRALPIDRVTAAKAYLYLWCPNALLPEGLAVLEAWGFAYKSNLVWHKVRKDGGSDGRGWGEGQECAYACARAAPSESVGKPQTRALAEARRAVRDYRILLTGTVPRTVRARHAKRLGFLGQSG
jgi:N6-adenosine-specific RNA methylase IME4